MTDKFLWQNLKFFFDGAIEVIIIMLNIQEKS